MQRQDRAMLRAQDLLEDAVSRTGLSDWDGEDFMRPLTILVDAAERESGLSAIGRERLRAWLSLRLEQRLRMVRDRKDRPEIARQAIERPIFQMGFPRAGTTYLHTLLSLDPGNIAPLYWQMCLPSPPPNDPAIDHAGSVRRIQTMLHDQGWLDPEIAKTHFHAADLPEEDYFAFEYSFISTGFLGFLNVPTYVNEVVAGDFAPAYAWHRRVLQALQVGAEGRRWILKAPEHTLHVATLTDEYPDALLVQHHRDPSKFMASVLSVLTACRSNYCTGPTTIGPDEARAFLQMYAAGIAQGCSIRDDPAFARRFADIHYLDLERDPIGCVRKVYDHADLDFTPAAEARVAGWVTANRKGKHGKHQYRLADYGLTQTDVHDAFAPYIQRFGVELEGDA